MNCMHVYTVTYACIYCHHCTTGLAAFCRQPGSSEPLCIVTCHSSKHILQQDTRSVLQPALIIRAYMQVRSYYQKHSVSKATMACGLAWLFFCCRNSTWNKLGAGEGAGQCSHGHAHTGHHLCCGCAASFWQRQAGVLAGERVR